MSQIIKIYTLFLGSALLLFGGGLQGLLLSVRGAEEGFSLFALGLIGTGWSVGFIAGSIAVPMLVRRIGHVRAFSVMAAVGTVTILLNLLWINDIGWIVLRAFSGFCFAGAAMVVESWLNEVSDNRSRGTVFSLYVTINMIASTAGQLAMSITGTAGHIPFVIGAISLILALLPTTMSARPQPRPLASVKLDIPLLYRTSPVAVAAAFSVGIANGTFGTLAPVYGYQKGFDTATIAYMMSLAAILGAASQIPFGRLSDRIDRRMVMIVLGALSAVSGFLIVLADPGEGVLLYVMIGMYGFFAYPVYAVAVAHANDTASHGDFAAVASGLLLVMGVGLAAGPILGALAMSTLTPASLFIVTAVFHGTLAAIAFIRMRVNPIIGPEGRTRFRALTVGKAQQQTTATVELDPRSDSDADPAR